MLKLSISTIKSNCLIIKDLLFKIHILYSTLLHLIYQKFICKSNEYYGLKVIFLYNLVGWILWHINHCRLFNAKSSLYIYIKYIRFSWVGFYGISTIVGYLMLNPLSTYILNIYDLVGLGFMAYQPL